MELNIRRTPIAFKDLYPDPVLRHRLHYSFAHQFIPKLVFGDLEEFFRQFFLSSVSSVPSDFIHRAWKVFEDHALPPRNAIERANRSLVIHQINELDMRFIKGDRPIYGLITMPPPEKPAQAYFVGAAVVPAERLPDNSLRKAYGRVFTLEATAGSNETGVFCEWENEKRRINYGVHVRTNVSDFFDAIVAKLQAVASAPTSPIPATSYPLVVEALPSPVAAARERIRHCPVCGERFVFRGATHGAEYVIPLPGLSDRLICQCKNCSSDLIMKGGRIGRIGPALRRYRSLSAIPILAVFLTYVSAIALIVCGALGVLDAKHWTTISLFSAGSGGVIVAALFAIVRGVHTGVISSPNLTMMPGADRYRSIEASDFWACFRGWLGVAALGSIPFVAMALGRF
jgi:hypothetical protein